MIRWLPLLAALGLSAYALSEPRVSLIRPPGIVSEGSEIVLQVRVPQHEDNRLLRVMLEEDGQFLVRVSDETLAGEQAPRTRWLKWILPPCDGQCVFIAQLWGVQGKVAQAQSPVTVISR